MKREASVNDLADLLAAILRSQEASRLIKIDDTVVTLSLGGTHYRLQRLPEAALRVLVYPSSPGAPLAGWAVDENNLAPVPAVLLLEAGGSLTPTLPKARPDIRATQGLDCDMTGFAVHRPEGTVATLFFLLRGGVVVKRIVL